MTTPLLGAASYTVTRPAPGSYPDGDWEESGPPTTFPIVASVQPLTGRERAALPEGYRETGRYKIYVRFSSPKLQTDTLETRQTADTLEYKGGSYAITSVLDWSDHAVNGATTAHRKYLLVLQGVDELEP